MELPITLSITHNFNQSQTDNIIIQWDLEKTIQTLNMKGSCCNYQRINTMSISF